MQVRVILRPTVLRTIASSWWTELARSTASTAVYERLPCTQTADMGGEDTVERGESVLFTQTYLAIQYNGLHKRLRRVPSDGDPGDVACSGTENGTGVK